MPIVTYRAFARLEPQPRSHQSLPPRQRLQIACAETRSLAPRPLGRTISTRVRAATATRARTSSTAHIADAGRWGRSSAPTRPTWTRTRSRTTALPPKEPSSAGPPSEQSGPKPGAGNATCASHRRRDVHAQSLGAKQAEHVGYYNCLMCYSWDRKTERHKCCIQAPKCYLGCALPYTNTAQEMAAHFETLHPVVGIRNGASVSSHSAT